MSEMTKGIDQAIANLQAQILEDSYNNGGYAGSKATEALAVEQINQRLTDAMALIDDDHKTIVQALWNGVIADVEDAGMQIRERYL